MSELPRPEIDYPCRVPFKVIGLENEMEPQAIEACIQRHLGQAPERDPEPHRKGKYVSYTFWVVLPDEHAEGPLRQEIHRLPGVKVQL